MRRRLSFLSILALTALLAGCAPKAVAQPADVRAPENPLAAPVQEPSGAAEIAKANPVPPDPPASCPVTTPQEPAFVPPSPYDALGNEGSFWYGSDALWTAVPGDGRWWGLPHHSGGYTQKIFWWRDGYIWNEEPEPDLVVAGERLDAPAPPFTVTDATNAYADDIGSAMLTGVDVPALGCWKITGKYGDAELSFVVWVAP